MQQFYENLNRKVVSIFEKYNQTNPIKLFTRAELHSKAKVAQAGSNAFINKIEKEKREIKAQLDLDLSKEDKLYEERKAKAKKKLLVAKWQKRRDMTVKLHGYIANTSLLSIQPLMNAKANTSQSRNLLDHLKHARNCKASDPRDRVYAFLSLV